MAFEFRETLNLEVSSIGRSLDLLESSTKKQSKTKKGLIVEIAAIHAGMTANFNYYSADELTASIESWTTPFGKPIILNHDPYSEAVGRAIGARMDTASDERSFVRLQAAITDPEAVEKIRDRRFLTGSVGGKAEEVLCSICEADWAAAAKEGKPACDHRKGREYEGAVAMFRMKKITFNEYSWVNMPADSYSQVLALSESEGASGFSNADVAKSFLLDFEEERIDAVSLTGLSNVLESMKKKEALPIYMGLKGSFLLAEAMGQDEKTLKDIEISKTNTTNNSSSENSEENFMSDNQSQKEEEDILDVLDVLSDDIQAGQEEAENSETEEDSAVEEEAAEEEDGENTPEEGQKAAGQEREKPHRSDDSHPDAPKDVPVSREEDEEDESETDEEKVEEEAVEDDSDSEETDTELVEEGETDEINEPHVEESSDEELENLRAENVKLTEENVKLRRALHRQLAERVVEAKASIGLDVGDWAKAVEEHSNRTASSLADSLRDLMVISPVQTEEAEETEVEVPTPVGSDVAVAGEESNTTMEEDELNEDEDVKPEVQLEDLVVDALMGRRTL